MKLIVFIRCATSFLFTFIFCISTLYAQTEYRSGYIVEIKGDTIYGEILYRGDLELTQKCDFRISILQTNQLFYPNQLISYGFEGDRKFVSKEFEGAWYFFEHFFSGDINFYFLQKSENAIYFIEKNESGLVEISYHEKMVTKDQTKYKYSSKTHLGLLTFYTQEAPELKEYIQTIKKPDHYNLKKLGKKYHKEINRADQFEIYESKKALFMIFPEAVVGYMNYRLTPNENSGQFNQVGVLVHIWMPEGSEKLFFRTGLLYNYNSQFKQGKKGFYKIPLHLEYIASTGIVRPRFSVGGNVYKPYVTLATTGGVSVNLHRNVSLSLTAEAEFPPVVKTFFLPWMAVGGFAGLFVKF